MYGWQKFTTKTKKGNEDLHMLHGHGLVSSFMKIVKTHFNCINVLDHPQATGPAPELIEWVENMVYIKASIWFHLYSFLSTDYQAWNTTSGISFATDFHKSDTISVEKSVRANISIHHSPKHISGFHNYAKVCGSSILEHNINQLCKWAFPTRDEFYTYPHYDTSGLCTYL